MSVNPVTNYPTVGAVMRRARAIVNDAYRGNTGRILKNTAPFSVEYVNGALEELQDKLTNNLVITFIRDNVLLTPIQPLPGGPNTGIEQWVGYEGFFNGAEMVSQPVIPGEIIDVLEVRVRPLGNTSVPFSRVMPAANGLGSNTQTAWLHSWEYRADRIYLQGCTSPLDMQVRGIARLPLVGPDVVNVDGTESWDKTQIAILASVNAIATLIAAQYDLARGGEMADKLEQKSEKFMRYIVRRYTRGKQRIQYRRRVFGNRDLSLSRPRTGIG